MSPGYRWWSRVARHVVDLRRAPDRFRVLVGSIGSLAMLLGAFLPAAHGRGAIAEPDTRSVWLANQLDGVMLVWFAISALGAFVLRIPVARAVVGVLAPIAAFFLFAYRAYTIGHRSLIVPTAWVVIVCGALLVTGGWLLPDVSDGRDEPRARG